MLVYNTLFPVRQEADISELVSIANTWIIGSPYSNIPEEEIEINSHSLEWKYETDSRTLEFIRGGTEGYEAFGVRYSMLENQIRWVTDVVGSKDAENFLVSIQVSHDTANPGEKIPSSKKPYIIRQFLGSVGGGEDGSLEVKDTPHYLDMSEIDLAADLMKGWSGLALPVIYVSSTSTNKHFVDVKKLAKWYSGMAHIVVEPNREFSFRLMQEVSNRNAYAGALGIYWPNDAGSNILLPRVSQYEVPRFEKEISKALTNGLNALRPPRRCTWGNLQEISARRRIEELKREGSAEIGEYIQAFDTEIRSKTEEIEAANREIFWLKSELGKLRSSSIAVEGDPVLVRGVELDLYENEYRELLLRILAECASQSISNNDTRREHILKDVLSANSSNGSIEEKINKVGSVMKSYKKMDAATRQVLEEVGFEIKGDGKHYKAIFGGNKRYIVTFPKTSSDHRAGRNVIAKIRKLLF